MALFAVTLRAQLKRRVQQPRQRTQRPQQLHLHSRQHSLFPIHFPTHSNTSSAFMPSSNHPHRQHHYKTYTLLKRSGLALVLETRNIILKQSKWEKDFSGKDLYIHLAYKDARPYLTCSSSKFRKI